MVQNTTRLIARRPASLPGSLESPISSSTFLGLEWSPSFACVVFYPHISLECTDSSALMPALALEPMHARTMALQLVLCRLGHPRLGCLDFAAAAAPGIHLRPGRGARRTLPLTQTRAPAHANRCSWLGPLKRAPLVANTLAALLDQHQFVEGFSPKQIKLLPRVDG